MDPLYLSYCLIDMAASNGWARLSQAARDVVRDCGCGHMIGERRGAAG